MSKINVLHSTVYNRIAAGEVVERPYSVVKELIENSIDAGANNIEIKIFSGGIEKIEVSDNGIGIEKNELNKVFLPHATSKISGVDDLYSIKTLGFRGEAMASIASVSKIKIASKPVSQNEGYSLICNGGTIAEVSICALNSGTIVTVNNLFYNTPARAKFLKSEKAELSDISNIVSRAIIGNPKISFKYYVDDKLIYQSFGDGLEESLISVYGIDSIKNSFYIDTIKNGIRISGYLGKHFYTKANRTYQSLFINGRYVINNTINSAISNAYASYLMKRQYPFYVLNIEIPFDVVDVNVHPNKTDVRFANNQVVYASIYSVVSAVLDGTSKAIDIVKENKLIDNFNNNDILNNDLNKEEENILQKNENDDKIKHGNSIKFKNYAPFPYKDIPIEIPDIKVCDHTYIDMECLKDIDNSNEVYLENKRYLEKLEKENIQTTPINFENETNKLIQEKIDFKEISYIGQAFNTYLFYEIDNNLYIIDQHAAHERILYDRLIEERKNNKIIKQLMLIPFVLNVNYIEFNFLNEKKEYLNELGIEIEDFGNNTFKISEIPSSLINIDLKRFFDDLLADINNINKLNSDIIKEKLSQMACKAAIKAGYKLSVDEVNELFKMIDGNMGLKCPHGRPISVKISRNELEKWFKRIT